MNNDIQPELMDPILVELLKKESRQEMLEAIDQIIGAVWFSGSITAERKGWEPV